MTRRGFALVAICLIGTAVPRVDPAAAASRATTLPTASIDSPYVADTMSTSQYHLTGSDGRTWRDIDPTNLRITFQAPVDLSVILMANADLWTANNGYNQDLGIAVSGGVAPAIVYPTIAGQPEAWKESGGFAGTRSPNAAFAETVIDLSAGQTYIFKLQWKTNKRDPGTIYAGAGPLLDGSFSNTRLTAQLIPPGWEVWTTESRNQYALGGSDGQTFQPVDPDLLTVSFSSTTSGVAFFEVNADLWTAKAGYNQDIGVRVTPFPNTTNMASWKESGGFAGTFSPNAAFAQGSIPIDANTIYTAEVVAKANKPDPYPIEIGAGPIAGAYSPTTLTVIVAPNNVGDAVDFGQLRLDNSDGRTWQPMDLLTGLVTGVQSSVDCVVIVGANADLFTASSGYNQDLGIIETIGQDPTEHLIAWKESGGYAGTFSPNAAYVEAVVQVSANTLYGFRPRWKQNRQAPANSIYAGAGPWPKPQPGIGVSYSPTRITLKPFGCS